jgi:alcohol dehydrogenase
MRLAHQRPDGICDCGGARLPSTPTAAPQRIQHHERERHIKTTFRAAQVTSPGAELILVDRTLADPGPGTVRVAVQACGICHSDSLFVEDHWPGVWFPVTPGHEIAGRIDAVGEGVQD